MHERAWHLRSRPALAALTRCRRDLHGDRRPDRVHAASRALGICSMAILFALLAGLTFGAGLTLSDMVNPARIQNFLDVAGHWDPTLIFVMAGALAVTALGYRWILGRGVP